MSQVKRRLIAINQLEINMLIKRVDSEFKHMLQLLGPKFDFNAVKKEITALGNIIKICKTQVEKLKGENAKLLDQLESTSIPPIKIVKRAKPKQMQPSPSEENQVSITPSLGS